MFRLMPPPLYTTQPRNKVYLCFKDLKLNFDLFCLVWLFIYSDLRLWMGFLYGCTALVDYYTHGDKFSH